jgi:hypothetical protein
MAEEQDRYFDPFGELISSFWALLPEQTANDVAKFKKDVLIGIKSVVDSVIDTEINLMERHVEMARDIRARWDREEAAYDTPPTDPTIDPTPSPS